MAAALVAEVIRSREQSIDDPFACPTRPVVKDGTSGPRGLDSVASRQGAVSSENDVLFSQFFSTLLGTSVVVVPILYLCALALYLFRARPSSILAANGIKHARAIYYGVLLLTVLSRFLIDSVPINWYPVISSAGRYAHVSFGVTRLSEQLVAWLPEWVAPATVIDLFIKLLSCMMFPLLLLLVQKLRREYAPNGPWIWSAVLLTFWPQFWFYGTTDCQHVISLSIWLLGVVLWADWRRRLHPWNATALICLVIMLALVRIETAPWALIWIVIFPPEGIARKWSTGFVFALAILGALGGSLLFHRGFSFLRILRALPWFGYLPIAIAETHLVQALVALLLSVCLVGGWIRRDRFVMAIAVGITLCMVSLIATDLDHPLEKVALRYFLVSEILLLLLVIEQGTRFFRLIGIRLRSFLAIALLGILATELFFTFSPGHQLTFQQEYRFLREALSDLPPRTEVCFFDPNANHSWPGEHNDLDAAFYLPDGAEMHYGMNIKAVHLAALPAEFNCRYYYESALCSMNFDLAPKFTYSNSLRRDIEMYQRECRAFRDRFAGTIAREQQATQHVFWSVWDPAEGASIPLRLFVKKMR